MQEAKDIEAGEFFAAFEDVEFDGDGNSLRN
jgi:hypothetical protein